MFADFKCPYCGEIKEISYPIKEGPPKTVVCDKCRQDRHYVEMERLYKGIGIQIPEDFADDTMTTISSRMKHSRPSGRDRVLY